MGPIPYVSPYELFPQATLAAVLGPVAILAMLAVAAALVVIVGGVITEHRTAAVLRQMTVTGTAKRAA